ncbi:MAG: hypothetical protein WB615_06110, partial [Candidatus Tumulicola sp.]
MDLLFHSFCIIAGLARAARHPGGGAAPGWGIVPASGCTGGAATQPPKAFCVLLKPVWASLGGAGLLAAVLVAAG